MSDGEWGKSFVPAMTIRKSFFVRFVASVFLATILKVAFGLKVQEMWKWSLSSSLDVSVWHSFRP